MRAVVLTVSLLLASAASATETIPAPPNCEWRAADPAFVPNHYLVCKQNNGSEIVAQLIDVHEYYERVFNERTYADALGGDAAAMRTTGDFYLYYMGDLQNSALAAEWYRKAAAKGDATAMLSLAMLSGYGIGMAKDLDAMKSWLQTATQTAHDNNDAYAMIAIAELFDGEYARVIRNDPKAQGWYKGAADHGDLYAALKLAKLDSRPGPLQDIVEAQHLFKKVGDSDNPYLVAEVASCFEGGTQAFIPDKAEAARLYRRAAEGGASWAMRKLAHMYQSGEGVEQDNAQALRWLEAAARKGNESAMEDLANAYRLGQGVGADPVKAASWSAAANARKLQEFDMSKTGIVITAMRRPPAPATAAH